jgi:hypothetical protein
LGIYARAGSSPALGTQKKPLSGDFLVLNTSTPVQDFSGYIVFGSFCLKTKRTQKIISTTPSSSPD